MLGGVSEDLNPLLVVGVGVGVGIGVGNLSP